MNPEIEKKVEEVVQAVNSFLKAAGVKGEEAYDFAYDLTYLLAHLAGLKAIDPEQTIELEFGEFSCFSDRACIAAIDAGDIVYTIDWDGKEVSYHSYRRA